MSRRVFLRDFFFHNFQVCDNQEAHDDKEQPRADLAEMDKLPAILLVRVMPSAEKRRDIFAYPDQKTDEKEIENQGQLNTGTIEDKG